ncbi:MAG TPA: membrane dipeptidase [Kofleriaceae bacterium]
MAALEYADHRADPGAWAKQLGISKEAVEVYLASDVIDLHVDSFIWSRVFGYDLTKRHGHGLLRARVYSQVDLPRIREAAVTGAIWVITTNPLRGPRGRAETFTKNLEKLTGILASVPDDVQIVKTTAEYRAAKAAGKHAAWIGIQGGNAVDDHNALDRLDDRIVRVTLVHLSNSQLGTTSSPLASHDAGISDDGRAYVEALNTKKIFVDLAHVSKKGFWGAVEAHDKSIPLICTHTGVSGVYEHWRNLDDDQLRAIADTGGTIGIMFESSFLGPSRRDAKVDWIAAHIMHVVETVGADHCSIGSDFDGAIVPPRDVPTCLELPRIVDALLRRGVTAEQVQSIFGGSYLRSLELLRG